MHAVATDVVMWHVCVSLMPVSPAKWLNRSSKCDINAFVARLQIPLTVLYIIYYYLHYSCKVRRQCR